MGMFRKATSVFSLGLVDLKSDKERTATSARKTKTAVRGGNRLLAEQNEILREGQSPPRVTQKHRQQVRAHVDWRGRLRK